VDWRCTLLTWRSMSRLRWKVTAQLLNSHFNRPVLGSVDWRLPRDVPPLKEELVNAPLSPLSEYDIGTHEYDLFIEGNVVGGGNGTSAASAGEEKKVGLSEC